eukprot:m.118373 g.118373  ORF g.118373 m.118373 type:complete len:191 (-) comp16428_c0_seq1:207-779(-)
MGIRSRQWIQGAPAYRKPEAPKPVYSDFAKRHMESMGSAEKLGSIVAASSQVTPPFFFFSSTPCVQVGTRGLGFQPGQHRFVKKRHQDGDADDLAAAEAAVSSSATERATLGGFGSSSSAAAAAVAASEPVAAMDGTSSVAQSVGGPMSQQQSRAKVDVLEGREEQRSEADKRSVKRQRSNDDDDDNDEA